MVPAEGRERAVGRGHIISDHKDNKPYRDHRGPVQPGAGRQGQSFPLQFSAEYGLIKAKRQGVVVEMG